MIPCRVVAAMLLGCALAAQQSEPGGSFDFFLDDNIDFRVRSSKANLDMVQQMLAMHQIHSWREH